jgi:hypothetical protein
MNQYIPVSTSVRGSDVPVIPTLRSRKTFVGIGDDRAQCGQIARRLRGEPDADKLRERLMASLGPQRRRPRACLEEQAQTACQQDGSDQISRAPHVGCDVAEAGVPYQQNQRCGAGGRTENARSPHRDASTAAYFSACAGSSFVA